MTAEPAKPADVSPTMSTRSKHVDTNAKVIPTDVTSAFADKVMIAIDENAGIVAMTLLQRTLHPQVSPNGWILSDENWKVIGEVKMPISEMNAVAIYHIAQITGGMNIIAMMQQYLKEHPRKRDNGISYGPTGFQVS